MNELYPIIQRKRQPLIEVNAEMPKAERVEPAKAAEVVKPETESREGGEGGEVKKTDANAAQST